ncbi:MAG: glutathione S-transferase family protein [Pseudomonadota bacterium]
MITLHHLEYSQSFRILWLLEAMGIEYELVCYNRHPKTHLAPDEYKALSPLKSAPVITDGDLVLAESSAIIDYLLDRYPSDELRPAAGSPHRTRYLFWFHAGQGTMMPLMLVDSLFRIMRERVPFFVKPMIGGLHKLVEAGFSKPRMDGLLALAEEDLAKADWFGGSALTAADTLMCYSMMSAFERGFINDRHPQCLAWIARMEDEPSFQRAKELDGRDSMVLPLR